MKRILYVHHFPTLGGSAGSLYLLLKHLDPQRFEKRLVQTHRVAGEVMGYFGGLGMPVDHLPSPLIWDHSWLHIENLRSLISGGLRPSPAAQRFLEQAQPDLVHINEFSQLPFGITAGRMGIPVIWHCRHVLSARRRGLDPGGTIIATIVRHARRIIGISESEAGQFASPKALVMYNPLEWEAYDRGRGSGPAARHAIGIPADAFLVIAPIPLTRDKGAWDFIQAAGAARRLAPAAKLHFLIVGQVPQAGRLAGLRRLAGGLLGEASALETAQRLARQAGVQDCLTVTGFRKDIIQLMDAADLVVFPSRLKEAGRPSFEGGALGKPVLVTLPDKNTGVVLDEVTGRILPEAQPQALGAAMAELAQDPAQGRRMGRAGYENVRRNHDARRYAENMMSLYDQVLSERV
jgi:glycosyltransferase involved in cell wall biosynthesis